jgi:GT2 family glycosyltransferase
MAMLLDTATALRESGGSWPELAERRTAERVRVDGIRFARGARRLHIQGVTYGPFAPNAQAQPFPNPEQVAEDFALMRAGEINALRTYHVPPTCLLDKADEHQLSVFVDVPWPKHLCFLDCASLRAEARDAVRRAAKHVQNHSCVLGLSIGNEVPADVVRWHGARRVERFLAELSDAVKQVDSNQLVTYASFPPTEYLELPFLDFATFNVYLHDREAFRRYLFRLQNLVGDKPLVLGELGMDTFRHGQLAQADFLSGHAAEARLMGLAGSFVFSWTDDWHTGGHPISDWAFGITHADRSPKASYHALREVFEPPPAALVAPLPRVTVVVCSYNSDRTLEQCLRSIGELAYPDYEVIVVDDGSTDSTGEILACFPDVRAIRQPNMGLSYARNVGLQAATSEIVAYTDSDCFVDPDWLTHLVYQLRRSGAAAVGGPNLTPEDGRLAACVAASPGQPTHVLVSDQVAEHIPGCNMAFRRDALQAINGFDPLFRKAGDDVDVCWRLQQAGMWITFAPGAFVWHHRRQGPRTYLKQQSGYGEAEALLAFKHPAKFNARGESRWRGVLYGGSCPGMRLSAPVIYRGTFATGLFQCIYRPGPAHWATLPSTLEWHIFMVFVAVVGLFWWPAWLVAGAMLALSLLVAGVLAAQARLPHEHSRLGSRLIVATLCYAQPLVRSWRRYRTWLFAFPSAGHPDPIEANAPKARALRGSVAYWGEEWPERSHLLQRVTAYLAAHRWGPVVDTGWSDWDLEVACGRWTFLRIRSAQEDHGGGKRLIRLEFRMRARGVLVIATIAATALTVVAASLHAVAGAALASVMPCLVGLAWWSGRRVAGRVVHAIDSEARQMKLIPCTAGGTSVADPARGH